MNETYNLKPLQMAELDIYNEIVKICNRHGLRHYTTGGTTLGAVRHKGFIPWDDDFDMCMPLPDQIKFLAYAEKELPSWLRVVSWRNCAKYQYEFAKVIICDEDMLDQLCKESGMPAPEGVFVDVFPMVGVPISIVGRMFRVYAIALCRLLMRLTHKNWFNGIMEWMAGFTPYDTAHRVTSWSAQYASEKALAGYDRRLWLTRDVYGDGHEVEFDGQTVRVPSEVDRYLEQAYGDWRKLPPYDLRRPSHVTSGKKVQPWRLGQVR